MYDQVIDKDYINKLLKAAKHPRMEEIKKIMEKAKSRVKLNHMEIAILLNAHDKVQLEEVYEIAGQIKEEIYMGQIALKRYQS